MGETMPIRVVYEFDVVEGAEDEFVASWRAIVDAHATEGALGSVLHRDPECEGRWVAMSRWVDRQTWELNRRDDAAPEAYAVFRRVVEVVSKRVLEEVEGRGAPELS